MTARAPYATEVGRRLTGSDWHAVVLTLYDDALPKSTADRTPVRPLRINTTSKWKDEHYRNWEGLSRISPVKLLARLWTRTKAGLARLESIVADILRPHVIALRHSWLGLRPDICETILLDMIKDEAARAGLEIRTDDGLTALLMADPPPALTPHVEPLPQRQHGNRDVVCCSKEVDA